jgi:hypothetical protein
MIFHSLISMILMMIFHSYVKWAIQRVKYEWLWVNLQARWIEKLEALPAIFIGCAEVCRHSFWLVLAWLFCNKQILYLGQIPILIGSYRGFDQLVFGNHSGI